MAKPPNDGGSFWAWVVTLVISHIAAMGAGVGLGEAGKERERRERDAKWKALLDTEREQNKQLKLWVEKMDNLERIRNENRPNHR